MPTKKDSLCNDGLVSITEAMQFLSVSRGTLYAMMSRSELEWTHVGGRRKIPRLALVKLADKNLVEADG